MQTSQCNLLAGIQMVGNISVLPLSPHLLSLCLDWVFMKYGLLVLCRWDKHLLACEYEIK